MNDERPQAEGQDYFEEQLKKCQDTLGPRLVPLDKFEDLSKQLSLSEFGIKAMYRVKEDFKWPLSLAKDFIFHLPDSEDQGIQLHCFLINNDCIYEGRVRPHKNELTMDAQFCVGMGPSSSDEESKDDEDQFPDLFPDPPKISFKAGTVIIVSNLAFEELKPRLKDLCTIMKVIENGLKGPLKWKFKARRSFNPQLQPPMEEDSQMDNSGAPE